MLDVNNFQLLTILLTDLDWSSKVGSLSLPMTESISSWRHFCTETWLVRSWTAQRIKVVVVSIPPIAKSRNVSKSCSRS